jgi:hypothetical protein
MQPGAFLDVEEDPAWNPAGAAGAAGDDDTRSGGEGGGEGGGGDEGGGEDASPGGGGGGGGRGGRVGTASGERRRQVCEIPLGRELRVRECEMGRAKTRRRLF